MTRKSYSVPAKDEAVTAALGQCIAPILKPGDTILLEGPVGAGKTHFARSLIQSILVEQEDVPSPSFTLVQTYETTKGPLWHCDLYRLGRSDVDDLGLDEAFETAICLIEWPDRLEELTPDHALRVRFDTSDASGPRLNVFEWTSDRWSVLESLLPHV
ncbi:MAG: tRNA (adenosine(37)-N6)-threonylcarbamoyltransferase complex ATPase subunit type 1 TsaE [Rhodobacteraceae bacterium]|nr:tRNA (adenosine(37)-N6)-threonylcarbamoyltransferase complex ATPase subunit type 1 TsaE [Paracoccaceae bacterium]